MKPAVFQRGIDSRVPATDAVQASFQQPAAATPLFSGRSVKVEPRSRGMPIHVETRNDAARDESVGILTGGITVLIEGALVENVPNTGTLDLGRIEIQADNAVAWTSNVGGMNLFGEAPRTALMHGRTRLNST